VTSSPNSSLPVAKRLDALQFLADRLVEQADLVLFTCVSGEQFNTEILPRLIELGAPTMGHEAALRHVFFNSLLRFMRAMRGELGIIVDSRVALPDAIKIQAVREPLGIYEGGVIYADSSAEEGLQLADLAAYTLNRMFHVKQRRLARPSQPNAVSNRNHSTLYSF